MTEQEKDLKVLLKPRSMSVNFFYTRYQKKSESVPKKKPEKTSDFGDLGELRKKYCDIIW